MSDEVISDSTTMGQFVWAVESNARVCFFVEKVIEWGVAVEVPNDLRNEHQRDL